MPNTKRVNAPSLFKATGVPGEMLISSYSKEEQRVDDLKIEDYRKMINNDGQIQMLWNAISNTVSSAGVEIVDDPSYEGEEDSEEKIFIEECLTAPIWQGGMDISIDQVNRTMLRAFIEGYRLFEVVYKLGDDNKIRLARLAPRSAGDDSGIKILVDDNGNYMGFHQSINFMGKRIDAEIKNEGDIERALKSTFGEEFGSLYGRSGLKAAWYHYDKAHKGMYLNHVGHEFGASKLRYLKTKGSMTEDKTEKLVEVAAKISQNGVLAIPETEAEITFESVSDAAVMAVGRDTIKDHYSMITKSILAQFVDLGTTETGSRALGESQISFFKEGLQTMGSILIENPWNRVIASLIKLNFNGDIYPRLRLNKIEDKTAELLYNSFIELLKQGGMTNSVKAEIQKLGSKTVGLDINEETIDQEMEEKEQKADEIQKQNAAIPQQNPFQKKVELQEPTEELNPGNRALYPDEAKTKFIDIENKMRTTEDRAKIVLRQKLDDQKQEVINQFLEAAREGRKNIRKVEVKLQDNAMSYSQELNLLVLELMEFGKLIAAEELEKAAPTTSKKSKQALEDKVDMVIEEQQATLKFRLQNVANDALTGGLPENEARLLLEQEYNNFFDTKLLPTIFALFPTALNWGRDITFQKYEDEIFAYRYTARMENTCATCAKLDGKIIQKSDPDYYMLDPPLHFSCHCMWQAITNKEQQKYNFRVDGKPTDIPVYSSISTFTSTSEKKDNDISLTDLIDD